MRYSRISYLFFVFLLTGFLVASSVGREMEQIDKNLVKINLTIRGQDEQSLIESASINAVQKCIGRLYASKYLIMARPLLENYLARYYSKFIYSVETVNKRHIGDDVEMELNIYVLFDELAKDLKEKRFLYIPRYKPYFAVFIEEKLDGQPASELIAHEQVKNVLKDRAVRLLETAIMYPPSNVDITKEPELLSSALKEAQKNGIELIISGDSQTRLVKKQQLYYDVFYFYENSLTLKLIRADTGEILFEKSHIQLAYDTDEQQAIKNCIIFSTQVVANALIDYYTEIWDKLFLNNVDYQILISGINKEHLKLLTKGIKSLHPQAEVYIRAFYKNTVVLNLMYPGTKDELQHLIKTFSYPNFRILQVTDKYLEAQKEY